MPWNFRESIRMTGMVSRFIGGLLAVWIGVASASGLEGEYRLGPGDKLQITVLQEERLSLEVLVSQQGTISFPILGQVQVAGHTAAPTSSILSLR